MQRFKKDIVSLLVRLKSRGFALGVFAVMFASIVLTITMQTKAVFIRDANTTTVKYTLGKNVDGILQDDAILTLANDDIVEFSGFIGNYGEINISRSFPVYVTHDGKTQEVDTTEITVDGLLEQLDISYDSNDILSIPADTVLTEEDELVLQRVEYQTQTVEEEIPFEVATKYSSLIKQGREKVLKEGRDGVKGLTYVQKTVDGVVSQTELVNEYIITEPLEQEVLVGDDSPVSPLDLGYDEDGNGVPTAYSKVITNAVATGYYSSPTAKGASGMRLSAGYVAVDPAEIPYGSELYITSADGSFEYGYAIAADTGVGLLQDVIDVDLYYDSYIESCLNGRKSVNIYVLS